MLMSLVYGSGQYTIRVTGYGPSLKAKCIMIQNVPRATTWNQSGIRSAEKRVAESSSYRKVHATSGRKIHASRSLD